MTVLPVNFDTISNQQKNIKELDRLYLNIRGGSQKSL